MDTFNINNIENFTNQELDNDISDISNIIKSMIALRNDKGFTPTKKKKKSYSIEDKIRINSLGKNIAKKIKKYHDEMFDLIGDAIDILSQYEYSITKDLYDFYESIYLDILDKLNIEFDDTEAIRNSSEQIYNLMFTYIMKLLYEGKKSDIPSNKRKTYTEAITAYVFYNCIFLIRIDNVNE